MKTKSSNKLHEETAPCFLLAVIRARKRNERTHEVEPLSRMIISSLLRHLEPVERHRKTRSEKKKKRKTDGEERFGKFVTRGDKLKGGAGNSLPFLFVWLLVQHSHCRSRNFFFKTGFLWKAHFVPQRYQIRRVTLDTF